MRFALVIPALLLATACSRSPTAPSLPGVAGMDKEEPPRWRQPLLVRAAPFHRSVGRRHSSQGNVERIPAN